MNYRLFLPILACFIVAGCSSFPKSVRVSDVDQLPSLHQLQKNTAAHRDETVVLGGIIVDVINNDNQTTLEILELKLFASGRPRSDTDASQGRFRVTFDSFLEPQIYAKGRAITVRGTVDDLVEGHIGNHPYKFIHLRGTGYHLWPEQPDEVQVRYYMGMNPYPFHPMYMPPPPPPRPVPQPR